MASGAESRRRFMRRFRRLSRRQVLRLLSTFAAHPAGIARALRSQARMSLQSLVPWQRPHFEVTTAWEKDLHSLLARPGPARSASAWIRSWLRSPPHWLHEGSPTAARPMAPTAMATVRCAGPWCTVRHACPEVAIETGVARGVTSRVVLEALQANDRGHLWSIDLPYPFDHELHEQIGVAVTDACRARWSYLEGSSSERLPPLIDQVGHVEVFIHDSLHTAKNTAFEMEQAASAMPPGGVMPGTTSLCTRASRPLPGGIPSTRPSSAHRRTERDCSASRSIQRVLRAHRRVRSGLPAAGAGHHPRWPHGRRMAGLPVRARCRRVVVISRRGRC